MHHEDSSRNFTSSNYSGIELKWQLKKCRRSFCIQYSAHTVMDLSFLYTKVLTKWYVFNCGHALVSIIKPLGTNVIFNIVAIYLIVIFVGRRRGGWVGSWAGGGRGDETHFKNGPKNDLFQIFGAAPPTGLRPPLDREGPGGAAGRLAAPPAPRSCGRP